MRAKFTSPSNKCKASPGGRFLNLAETVWMVSGSRKTFQPVTDATPSRTRSNPVDLMSAVTTLRLVFQLSVSAARAGLEEANVKARHRGKRLFSRGTGGWRMEDGGWRDWLAGIVLRA